MTIQYAHISDFTPYVWIPDPWTDPATGHVHQGLPSKQGVADVYLAALGWYPVSRAALKPWQIYDDPYLDDASGQIVFPAVNPADPLAAAKAWARNSAENERNRRIDLLTGPERDKLHSLATVSTLQQKQISNLRDPANAPPLTPEEEGMVATMVGIAGMIQAHDTVLAQIETDIDAATTVADVEAIESAIPTDHRWP